MKLLFLLSFVFISAVVADDDLDLIPESEDVMRRLNSELDRILMKSKHMEKMSSDELRELSARVDNTVKELEIFAEKRLGLNIAPSVPKRRHRRYLTQEDGTGHIMMKTEDVPEDQLENYLKEEKQMYANNHNHFNFDVEDEELTDNFEMPPLNDEDDDTLKEIEGGDEDAAPLDDVKQLNNFNDEKSEEFMIKQSGGGNGGNTESIPAIFQNLVTAIADRFSNWWSPSNRPPAANVPAPPADE